MFAERARQSAIFIYFIGFTAEKTKTHPQWKRNNPGNFASFFINRPQQFCLFDDNDYTIGNDITDNSDENIIDCCIDSDDDDDDNEENHNYGGDYLWRR